MCQFLNTLLVINCFSFDISVSSPSRKLQWSNTWRILSPYLVLLVNLNCFHTIAFQTQQAFAPPISPDLANALFHSSQKPTRKLAARTFTKSRYLKELAASLRLVFCDEWKRGFITEETTRRLSNLF